MQRHLVAVGCSLACMLTAVLTLYFDLSSGSGIVAAKDKIRNVPSRL